VKYIIQRLPREMAKHPYDSFVVTLIVNAKEADRIANDFSVAEDLSKAARDMYHLMDTLSHNDDSAIAACNANQEHR
jgi:ABC-type proline/glycine betaine transport system ATPase subunit